MTINRFDGDPKLTLGPDGSNLVYKSGQPVMDQGIENQIFFDLFIKSKGKTRNQNGWWANLLTDDPLKKYGSDYVDTVINQPITLNGLSNIEKAAKKALNSPIYGDVEVVASNPEANRINVEITVKSPGEDIKVLIQTDNVANWVAQALEPANRNI